ncbi:hypothetical protein [Xenorhabdus hominickii]|nr:hypothetical protein [Xenorhabdus hominickii]
MLKECIDSVLYGIETAQRVGSETKAEKIAESTLKMLPLFHSQKVEESQRQQHRVMSLDGAVISGSNYFEKMSFVSSCIQCVKDKETSSMDKSILKRVHGSEKYPVTWIIQLGAKEALFSRVTNGRIDEETLSGGLHYLHRIFSGRNSRSDGRGLVPLIHPLGCPCPDAGRVGVECEAESGSEMKPVNPQKVAG